MKKSEEMRLFFENRVKKDGEQPDLRSKTVQNNAEKHEATTIQKETTSESILQKIKKKIVKIKD